MSMKDAVNEISRAAAIAAVEDFKQEIDGGEIHARYFRDYYDIHMKYLKDGLPAENVLARRTEAGRHAFENDPIIRVKRRASE